jgi:peptidyl-prolyl cis-trans isomerase D
MELVSRPVEGLKPNAFEVPTLDAQGRGIVAWAFSGEVGEAKIWDPSDLKSNKFVVATITEAKEKGVSDLESVRERITPLVIRDIKKQQLGDRLRAALAGSTSINDVASKLGLEVQQSVGLSFDSRFVQGVGGEPLVAAAAAALDVNELSMAIDGNSGVFAIQLKAKTDPPEQQDLSQQRQVVHGQLNGKFGALVRQSVIDGADVDDFRYRYY